MRGIVDLFRRYTTGKKVIILLLFTLLAEAAFTYSNSIFSGITGFPATLDMTFFYSLEFAQSYFATMPPAGKEHYLRWFATIDVIFPILYSLLFSSFVTYLLKRKRIEKSRWELLIFFPFLPMVFDYMENITSILLLIDYTAYAPFLLPMLIVSSWTKWASAFAGSILLAMLLFAKKRDL